MLRIKVHHTLTTPEPSPLLSGPELGAKTRTYKIQRPNGIEILPHSPQLTFTLAGRVDDVEATADEICASGIGRHLLKCMRRNATLLGIHNISDIYLENGIPNVSFTSSHPLSDSTSPCLNFVSLELVYAWVTAPKGASEDDRDPDATSTSKLSLNPINSRRINPFAALLDQVVRRLFSHHILRNYPLIFGPYSHSIRAEQALFPSAAKSLCSILKRSKHRAIKQNALMCIKQLRVQNALGSRCSRRAVRNVLPSTAYDSDSEGGSASENDETGNALETFTGILVRGLTNVYQGRIKPWNKGLHIDTHDDVDEDLPVMFSGTGDTGIHKDRPLSTLQGSSRQESLLPIWEEGRDPPVVDQDDMMALDWHSGGEDERREEDDDDDSLLFDLYDKASLEPHIVSASCFSRPAETAQSILNPTAPFDSGSDSGGGLRDALTDQSHDIPKSCPYLTHCHPLFSNTLTLLADPACEIDTLSNEHEAGLLTTQLSQGSRQPYIRLGEVSSVVPDGVADLGLQSEDSDMEVLDFDWRENADGLHSALEGSLTPDPFSQGSSGSRYYSSAGSPFTDGQSITPCHVDFDFDFDGQIPPPPLDPNSDSHHELLDF